MPMVVTLACSEMLDNSRASYFTMAYNLFNAGEKACNCFAFSSVCDME